MSMADGVLLPLAVVIQGCWAQVSLAKGVLALPANITSRAGHRQGWWCPKLDLTEVVEAFEERHKCGLNA